ncbi:MAG: hypothetical protein GEV03_15770 [Streptosporangiales bacterium]|nr:hypothetical protein [Streptosporangiales bacterium]
MSVQTLERALDLARQGQAGVLATVVWRRAPSSGQVGTRAVVYPDGRIEGFVGGACAEPVVVRESLRALADNTSRLLFLAPHEELPDRPAEGTVCVPLSCHSEGALQIYLEPIVPTPHLVVVGHTPAARVLADMAADLGWRTVLADASGHEPPATEARVLTGLDLEAAGVGPGSLVVVATQGHYDEDALRAALATDAAYVGLVASRTRAARILAAFRAAGVPDSQLARVRAPAGLDLGPTGHDEIAVAVLAELVQLKAAGQIRPQIDVRVPATATDPAGGMTASLHACSHGGA